MLDVTCAEWLEYTFCSGEEFGGDVLSALRDRLIISEDNATEVYFVSTSGEQETTVHEVRVGM